MFIHHANGVSAELKMAAADLAAAGYAAIAPNLFQMLGMPGTRGLQGAVPSYIGAGTEAQKLRDDAFLRVMAAAWKYHLNHLRTPAQAWCLRRPRIEDLRP